MTREQILKFWWNFFVIENTRITMFNNYKKSLYLNRTGLIKVFQQDFAIPRVSVIRIEQLFQETGGVNSSSW